MFIKNDANFSPLFKQGNLSYAILTNFVEVDHFCVVFADFGSFFVNRYIYRYVND